LTPILHKPRIVLSDIARAADVHVTTVSLALRNNPRIPEVTRNRIQILAKELGYQRDPFLQALVAYRYSSRPRANPPTLAYITNWSTRFGWRQVTAHPEFYESARKKALEYGFKLEHFWLREPGLTHDRLSEILHHRGITSLILASHSREGDDRLKFNWPRFHAVKIDYLPRDPEIHCVANDQFSVIRLAVQRVRKLGYRRIGFVMHRGWNHGVNRLWTAGFLCEQDSIPSKDKVPPLLFPQREPADEWMSETKLPVAISPTLFKQWYKTHRPEVIISKQSFISSAAAKLGLKIPRDVAFADIFLEDQDHGEIAGVRQNHETVGSLAVEILASQLHRNRPGIPEVPTTTQVEGTWFDGKSCPAVLHKNESEASSV